MPDTPCCSFRRSWNASLVISALVIGLVAVPGTAVEAAGDARLAEAAMKRDTVGVRALLAQGVDVNAPGSDGTPALHWLVRVDDIETARLLTRAGADATRADRYGVTPLHLACANGNAAMIRLLLEAGANQLERSHRRNCLDDRRAGWHLDAIRELLDRGATLDARDPTFQQTALMLAVRQNHPEVVRFLVERGAEVNVRKTRTGEAHDGCCQIRFPDSGMASALSAVAYPNAARERLFPELSSVVCRARRPARDGSDSRVGRCGRQSGRCQRITPLVMAISNNHVDVARFLMDHGADINASDWHGRTPLWAAVETRNMDVDNATFENSVDRAPLFNLIEALLARGANPNVRTKEVPPSGARCFVSQAHCHGWTSPVRHLF